MQYRRSAFEESDKHACNRLSHEFGFSVWKVLHLACSPRKELSAAETLAYQRAVQKGEGGRVAAMKAGVDLIDRDHPRETRGRGGVSWKPERRAPLPLSPG